MHNIVMIYALHDRPTVERMNDFAPAHSRLFKEVSLIALLTTRHADLLYPVDDHCIEAFEALRV